MLSKCEYMSGWGMGIFQSSTFPVGKVMSLSIARSKQVKNKALVISFRKWNHSSLLQVSCGLEMQWLQLLMSQEQQVGNSVKISQNSNSNCRILTLSYSFTYQTKFSLNPSFKSTKFTSGIASLVQKGHAIWYNGA